jgi:hypothetical protein
MIFKVVSAGASALLFGSLALRFTNHHDLASRTMGTGFAALIFRPGPSRADAAVRRPPSSK